jgi:hypothetical protein
MECESVRIDELMHAFANQLAAKCDKSVREIEDILWRHLREYIVSWSLDNQLRPAPVPMIMDEIAFEYDRAAAAGEKPPNIKEVSRTVQLVLQQKGYRASRSQIEKLAEAFRSRRWPPGKRR